MEPIHFLRPRSIIHMDKQTSTVFAFCPIIFRNHLECSLQLLFSSPQNKKKTLTAFCFSLCISIYRLSIPSLKRNDAGLYQCMVRNRMGALIHRKTEVHVACKCARTHADKVKKKKVKTSKKAAKYFPFIAFFLQCFVCQGSKAATLQPQMETWFAKKITRKKKKGGGGSFSCYWLELDKQVHRTKQNPNISFESIFLSVRLVL